MGTMDSLQISSHQALLSEADLGPQGDPAKGKSNTRDLAREAIGFLVRTSGALHYLDHEGKEVAAADGFFVPGIPYLIGVRRVFDAGTTIPAADILLLYSEKF